MVVTKRTAGHRAKGQGRAHTRETSHSPPLPPRFRENGGRGSQGAGEPTPTHAWPERRPGDERAMRATSTARTSSPRNLRSRDDGARRFARLRILERPLLDGVHVFRAAAQLVAHRWTRRWRIGG